MKVPYRSGLIRVAAFVVVGLAVVLSTQILRSDDPVAAVGRVSSFVRGLFVSADPAPPEGGRLRADPQLPLADAPAEVVAEVAVPKVVTLATAQTSAPAPSVPEACNDTDVSAGSIMVGDRVQLRFFARVGMPRPDEAAPEKSTVEAVAFERLDLSGIYEVGADGTTSLPLVGRLNLAGLTLACTEALAASAVVSQDSSVTAVTASFAARLPVTVGGAVRAPGSYAYAPGMTVDRLLGLSGATFREGAMTPQDFETLLAQRDELQRRQILTVLELRRLQAALAGEEKMELDDAVLEQAPPELAAPLIAAETAALQQDLSVTKIGQERDRVAITGLKQRTLDVRKQLDLVTTQLANLQERVDQMTSLKSKGLLQASQLDVLVPNLMELNRIKLQLETEDTNLQSQIGLAEENARLTAQQRRQDLTLRIADLSGQVALLESQRGAVDGRLAAQGIGDDNGTPPLKVVVERTEPNGAYRFDAGLRSLLLPGDMVTVSLPRGTAGPRVSAANTKDGEGAQPADAPVQE